MKTKEEIRTKWIRHTPLLKLDDCVDNAMEEYASQFQEDMSEKKYTEEDMIAFAYQFSSINVADFRKHLKDFDINLKEKNKQK